MKKLLKKFLFFYLCIIVGFIGMGQMMTEKGILTKVQISCQSGECVVAEKYLLNDNVFQQFSFHQKDAEDMWLKEDGKGYYKLRSSFDKITQCSNCGDVQSIRFPFNWWWKSSAEKFINTLKTAPEVQYTQYNRAFSWLGIVLISATIIVLGLYKLKQVK